MLMRKLNQKDVFKKMRLLVNGFFILPLGAFGIMHFVVSDFFEALVPQFAGNASFWVAFSGIALTGASVTIFMNYYSSFFAGLLMIFVLVFILTVDIPNVIHPNGWAKHYFVISLLKDISLFGGCGLIILLNSLEKAYFRVS